MDNQGYFTAKPDGSFVFTARNSQDPPDDNSPWWDVKVEMTGTYYKTGDARLKVTVKSVKGTYNGMVECSPSSECRDKEFEGKQFDCTLGAAGTTILGFPPAENYQLWNPCHFTKEEKHQDRKQRKNSTRFFGSLAEYGAKHKIEVFELWTVSCQVYCLCDDIESKEKRVKIKQYGQDHQHYHRHPHHHYWRWKLRLSQNETCRDRVVNFRWPRLFCIHHLSASLRRKCRSRAWNLEAQNEGRPRWISHGRSLLDGPFRSVFHPPGMCIHRTRGE